MFSTDLYKATVSPEQAESPKFQNIDFIQRNNFFAEAMLPYLFKQNVLAQR